MSTVLAISISGDEALLVAAEQGESRSIEILDVRTCDLAASVHDSAATQAPDSEESDSTLEGTEDKGTPEAQTPTAQHTASVPSNGTLLDFESELDLEIDSTLAVAPANFVLYKKLALPFSDQKRIDQVAPLQIQDRVPFEIDSFVVDNKLLGKNDEGSYEVISSLIPGEEVARSLSALKAKGVDPKLLTTKASSLAGLANLFPDVLEGSYGILDHSPGWFSLLFVIDNQLIRLRDIPLSHDILTDSTIAKVSEHIRSSVAEIERTTGVHIPHLFTSTSPDFVSLLNQQLPIEVRPLDLSSLVSCKTTIETPLHELSWAIGLVASELTGGKQSPETFVDFRKGPFSYQPVWRNFWSALKQELYLIILAILFGVSWCIATIYTSHSALQSAETRITEVVSTAVPGEEVPRRREVEFMEEQITELEEQLRGIGSLSSLSPLESLKELSLRINTTIDIEIDSLSIGSSSISFRGSVPDNRAIGTLSGALERAKDRFCVVNVNPKGTGKNSRVTFSAEVKLCD